MDNLTGSGFYPLYLALTGVLIFWSASSDRPLAEDSKRERMLCWLLAVFFIIFFAVRPHNRYFPDTQGYAVVYYNVQDGMIIKGEKAEVAFEFVRDTCAAMGLSVEVYFGVVATLYLVAIVLSCQLVFPRHPFIAMLGVVTSFAFYSGGGAIIRNGIAMSWMLWAISLWLTSGKRKKRRWIAIAIAICAYYFHHSIALTIAAFAASLLLIKSTKTALWIWIGAIFVALLIGRPIGEIASDWIGDDRLMDYVEAGLDEKNFEGFSSSRFRWDFLLYSVLGIAMIYYCTIKKKIRDKTYIILSNTYILANAMWIILIYSKFTDRFARLSWIIMPFVLLYPILKLYIFNKIQKDSSIVLWGQWLFLVLMGWRSLLFILS